MILARLFVVIGSLIVLVLTVALVGPYFVDWSSYRADFEREASAILGRRVTVNGSASARLLPFPSVTFSDVAVAGGPGGEPAMTVETFSMDAELAPFLRGEVLIFDMRMQRPRVVVEISDDGTVDWSMRPSAPPAISSVAIERLAVSDGSIEIRHRLSGRTHLVEGLQAEMSARSLRGPWRLDGSAEVEGIPLRLSLSTAIPTAEGDVRVRVRASPDSGGGFAVDAEGLVSQGERGATFSGGFSLVERPNDKGDRKPAKGPAAPGFRLSGDFTLANDRLDVADFRFETGPLDNPYTADGRASVEFGAAPRFSIEADGAQVRLDQAIGAEDGTTLTLGERLSGFRQALAAIPRLPIPGQIAVNLPAVVVGDTMVRDVRLTAEPAAGGWTVQSATATLPGRATLEADGFLRTEETIAFEGSLLLAVAQPSGFAAWLAKDIDEAIRRLPAAGFSASVSLGPERQHFRDLELVLGAARFTGEIDSRQPANARPAAIVRLEGGAVDEAAMSALAALFVGDGGHVRFADVGIDAEIAAGPVTIAGLTAGRIDTAMRLRRAQLEIDRLSISDLAGTSVSATGSLSDFPDRPAGQIDASIVSVDLAPLVAAANEAFPASAAIREVARRLEGYPGLLADARTDLVASLSTEPDGRASLAVSLQGNAGGTALSASLSSSGMTDRPGEMPFSLSVSARNAEAGPLLAMAGFPVLPIAAPGGGELAVSLDGSLIGGMKSRFELRGEGLLATFDGDTALSADGPVAKGAARISSADIEPWLLAIGASYPGIGLGMAAELDAQADFGTGLLVLEGIRGALGEVAVSGDLNVRLSQARPEITGALVLDELALDPFAETVLGQGTLALNQGDWPEVPFAPAAALPFLADVNVSTSRVNVGTAALRDATFTLRLDQEGLRLDDLKASFAGGSLSGQGELKNPAGTGLLAAQFTLTDARLASDGLAATATVGGSVSGSGKSVGSLVGSMAGSGTVHLSGVHIQGLNARAFPALLLRADAVGRDIGARHIEAFAPEIVSAGAFDGGSADLAYTLAGGILRAPPVTMRDGGAQLTVEPRIDLSSGSMTLDGTLTYDAGADAVAGTDPELRYAISGPIGLAELTFDVDPMVQFLTQRALEKEQARVEAMQAVLLERQRLRREVRYYAALQAERERQAAEEMRAAEEAARARLLEEEDARRRAEQVRAQEEAPDVPSDQPGESPAPEDGSETSPQTGALPPDIDAEDPELPAQGPVPPPSAEPAPRQRPAAAADPVSVPEAFPPQPPQPGLIDSFIRSIGRQ